MGGIIRIKLTQTLNWYFNKIHTKSHIFKNMCIVGKVCSCWRHHQAAWDPFRQFVLCVSMFAYFSLGPCDCASMCMRLHLCGSPWWLMGISGRRLLRGHWEIDSKTCSETGGVKEIIASAWRKTDINRRKASSLKLWMYAGESLGNGQERINRVESVRGYKTPPQVSKWVCVSEKKTISSLKTHRGGEEVLAMGIWGGTW